MYNIDEEEIMGWKGEILHHNLSFMVEPRKNIQHLGMTLSDEENKKRIIEQISKKPHAICVEVSNHTMEAEREVANYFYENSLSLYLLSVGEDSHRLLKELSTPPTSEEKMIWVVIATILADSMGMDIWAIEPYHPFYIPETPRIFDYYREVREPLVALNLLEVEKYYEKNGIVGQRILNITGDYHVEHIRELLMNPSKFCNVMSDLDKKIINFTKDGYADGTPANPKLIDMRYVEELVEEYFSSL